MDGIFLELADQIPGESSPLAAEESALIRRAQAGDRGAFDVLVRRYDRDVLRLAMRTAHSQDEAADLYQEAFLKVYRSLARFRFESAFYTWLYRVVTNVCLDHLRERKRRAEVQAPQQENGEAEYFQSLPDDRPQLDPERALQAREIDRRIRDALDGLTPRERLVFELKHYQGLKLRVIGECCGTTEETAKNCLFRATQKMRLALGDLI